jgi:hypothetical protein
MLRKGLVGAVALLVLFHAGLLAGQVWNGQLAEPGLLARWLIAGGLVWALAALGRQGASLFVGKRAVAIWLLAVLLHAPSVHSRIDSFSAPAVPEVVATLSQAVATAALGLAFLLVLGASRRAGRVLDVARLARERAPIGFLSCATIAFAGPRPPPRR